MSKQRGGCGGCVGNFLVLLVVIFALYWLVVHPANQPASMKADQSIDKRQK